MKIASWGLALAIVCVAGCDTKTPASPASESAVSSVSSQMALISASASAAAPSQAEVDAGAAGFIAAIKSKDFAALRAYYPDDYPADELKSDAPDPSFARKTLQPIVTGETMAAKLVSSYDNDSFGILFYRRSVADHINDPAYLKSDAYLTTFFVCNFTRRGNGHWQIAGPILCYDETEGPYEDIGSG